MDKWRDALEKIVKDQLAQAEREASECCGPRWKDRDVRMAADDAARASSEDPEVQEAIRTAYLSAYELS